MLGQEQGRGEGGTKVSAIGLDGVVCCSGNTAGLPLSSSPVAECLSAVCLSVCLSVSQSVCLSVCLRATVPLLTRLFGGGGGGGDVEGQI